MRVLFGIVLGVALTVGVAFISDNWSSGTASNTSTTGSSASVTDRQNMVNWSVVGDNLRSVGHSVRQTWNRLSQKVAS